MAQTHKGKVTPEFLDRLEKMATFHKTSWVMGINNYTLQALINEVREHRSEENAE